MPPVNEFSFFLPFLMLTFGASFLLVARAGSAAALYWGLGHVAAAAALFVPVALMTVPAPLQSVVADILFLGAFVCFGQAVLVRFGQPRRVAETTLFVTLSMTAIGYAVLVAESLRIEILIDDLSCAALLGSALFAARRGLKRTIDRALAVVITLVVIETLVRTIWFFALASSDANWETFTGSGYYAGMQITASCLGLL